MNEIKRWTGSEDETNVVISKPKILRNFIWFPILAYVIVMIGALPASITEVIVNAVKPLSPVQNLVFFSLGMGFGLTSLIIFTIVKWREKRPLTALGFLKKDALKNYSIGFCIGILMMGSTCLIIMVFGGLKLNYNAANTGMAFLPTILFTLIGWTIQGSTEEILTRGWMLPQLTERYNFLFSTLVTSIFFMALHLGNNSMSVMPIINLILFAVFAALYAAYTGNIWGICGFHVSWNWMQGNLLGIEVSGSNVPGGSLVSLQAQGNELVSGGSFGVEGSIIATLIFGLASFLLAMKLMGQYKKLRNVRVYHPTAEV